MKNLLSLFAAGALVLAPAATLAEGADIPLQDWQGGYVGLQGVYFAPVGVVAETDYYDDNSFEEAITTGLFGGYLWQNGRHVYGAELNFVPYEGANQDAPGESAGNAFSVRARGGISVENYLLYGAAGFAHQFWFSPGFPEAHTSTVGVILAFGVDMQVTDALFVGSEFAFQNTLSLVNEPFGFDEPHELGLEATSISIRAGYRF